MHGACHKLVCAAAALFLSGGMAQAAEVKVLIAGALQNAIRPLAADFEKETGNKVTITASNPALLPKELADHPYDVVASAVPTMGEFAEGAKFQPGTQTRLARTGIGIAIKEGAKKPDLSTIEAFKKAVRDAKNIIYTDPLAPNASGGNAQHILVNAGLLDEVTALGERKWMLELSLGRLTVTP
ncbi:MAG: substrate-binding domain-containing protein [Acidobacteriia bacterium]|nr:substrate-binding domain-containing protein [Terriglobia bacterium]